jgi:hypothetical protein
MQLTQKVKTCLDETRMLIMGPQILLGLGLHGVSADAFEQLAPGKHRACLVVRPPLAASRVVATTGALHA